MNSSKIAIFPGSFDPFTVGHEAIINRGLALFDQIIVSIGSNSNKSTHFSLEARTNMINDVFKDIPAVTVQHYEGLTVEFAKECGASFILRGIRTSADFEYERAIAQINKKMSGIESVFLLTTPEHTPVNSTIIRDILRHGGDASDFLPRKLDIKKYL